MESDWIIAYKEEQKRLINEEMDKKINKKLKEKLKKQAKIEVQNECPHLKTKVEEIISYTDKDGFWEQLIYNQKPSNVTRIKCKRCGKLLKQIGKLRS